MSDEKSCEHVVPSPYGTTISGSVKFEPCPWCTIAALRAELAEAKAKNVELHRRCQFAEGAVLRKMESEQIGGAPIAKRLAIAGYAAEQERRIEAEAQLSAAKAENERLRDERDAAGKLAHGIEADATDLACDVNDLRALLRRLQERADAYERSHIEIRKALGGSASASEPPSVR